MRSAKRSSFAGLAAYITSAHGKEERVGAVRTSNLASVELDDAVREVAATQGMNTRATGDKTYHLVVSFAPGEQPSNETVRAIEDAVCGSIGFGEHERLSAVHHDTDAVHVHIAINKVHPRTFNLHEPYRAYRTLGKVAAELEQRFGLQATNHSPRKGGGENRADDMTEAAGIETLRDWIRRTCLDDMRAATSWPQLHDVAAQHGLSIVPKGAGLAIVSEDGTAIKPSTVARDLARGALESRLGEFVPREGRDPVATTRYETRPVVGTADGPRLFARYQAERASAISARRTMGSEARARRNAAIEAAMRRNRLERAAIKLVGSGGAMLTPRGTAKRSGSGQRKLLYSLAARRLSDSIKAAQERYARDQAALRSTPKPLAWADWLQVEAAAGDAAALAALRARRKRQAKVPGIAVPAEVAAVPEAGSARLDGVTKHGTLIYSTGQAAVRDDGARLSLSRGAGEEAIAVALRVAAARFGTTLDISGSEAFRARVAAVAALTVPGVTFLDPETERRRQAAAAMREEQRNGRRHRPEAGNSRAGGLWDRARPVIGRPGQLARSAAQPDLGKPDTRPPAHRRDYLRTLSALGMVRVAGRSEVLLPGDVPDNVEQQGATAAPRLRRASDRAGVAPTSQNPGDAAAEAYASERNKRRQLIADIPQHVRYSGVSETLAFAGTRTVQGQRLVLLQRGETILVKPIDEDELNALPKRLGRAVRIENGKVAATRTRRRTQ